MPHKHTAVDLGINTASIPASTQSTRGFQANAPYALDHQEMCSDYSFQVPSVLALPRARAELQSKDRKGKSVTRKTLGGSFCLHSRGKCLSAHSPRRQQPTFQLKNACKVQRGDWFYVDLTVALTDVQALHFLHSRLMLDAYEQLGNSFQSSRILQGVVKTQRPTLLMLKCLMEKSPRRPGLCAFLTKKSLGTLLSKISAEYDHAMKVC